MKYTKVKALIVATVTCTMLMTPMLSMATDVEVTDPDNTGSKITGDGSLEGFAKEEAYCVVLPTTVKTDVDFVLDPQGLLHKTDNINYPSDTTGQIIFDTKKDKSKVISAKNKSSFPVKFSADINVTNMTTDAAQVKFVDKDGVAGEKTETTDTTKDLNLYLSAIPKKTNYNVTDKTTVADSTGISVVADSTGVANLSFVLDGVKDNYTLVKKGTNDYAYEMIASPVDTKWEEAAFSLTGAVNEGADWSGFLDAQKNSEKLSIDVAFTMKKYDGDYATAPWMDPTQADAYRLVKNTNKSEATVQIGDASVELPFVYPEGATSVTSVGTTDVEGTLCELEFTTTGSKIVLSAAGTTNSWFFGANATVAHKYEGLITFDNAKTLPFTLDVTLAP